MAHQIAFLTLFLGLTAGTQPVELTVSGPVAAVELRLDGQPVGRLEKPPWRLPVDFGAALLPHRLEAVALDPSGQELARAGQWVNLPRSPAEVDLVLENGPEGRPAAVRVTWQSLVAGEPELLLTFDGKPLPVIERRAALPRFSPDLYHVLSAELRFASGVSARRDLVLGGLGSEVSTELTAVPLLSSGKRPPSPAELQGKLLAAGRPLAVKAVDSAPEQLLVVRDLRTREALERLGSVGRGYRDTAGRPFKDASFLRYDLTLEREARLRLVWPRARLLDTGDSRGLPIQLFDSSRDFTARDGGLHWLLTQVTHPDEKVERQRFTDAVAVAGLQALAGNRRRAVLLVLGEETADASQYTPAMVRRYLEGIRVPLYVWSLTGKPGAMTEAWGGAADVSSLPKLRRAFSQLRSDLEKQSIVWVEGLVLPQEITLAPGSGGLSLAGAR